MLLQNLTVRGTEFVTVKTTKCTTVFVIETHVYFAVSTKPERVFVILFCIIPNICQTESARTVDQLRQKTT